MNLGRLQQSFKDAWRGAAYVYKHEQNFRIQLFFGMLVVILMLVLQLRKSEMLVILLLILLVLILELLNSAQEKFLDVLKPRMHLQVAMIKDILAAMVLMASLGSILIGGLIFFPYLISYL